MIDDLPEITEVQRVTVKPGDSIIVRVPVNISAETAKRIGERVRYALRIPEDARVLILDADMRLEVVEAP